ncbi:MAG: asparaginase domain-containing protein [Desulfonatronovibrionaceae bacterium]
MKILITGGTLDKEYRQIDGKLVLTKTHVNEILQTGKSTVQAKLEIVMLKDSLFMDERDRQTILNRCLESLEKQIIITHGTDTMAETAGLLGERIKDKTVVLVGAMIPYTFRGSDAVFNLGFAMAAVQTLPAGVYIAMNARIFPWYDVRKNKSAETFEPAGQTGC